MPRPTPRGQVPAVAHHETRPINGAATAWLFPGSLPVFWRSSPIVGQRRWVSALSMQCTCRPEPDAASVDSWLPTRGLVRGPLRGSSHRSPGSRGPFSVSCRSSSPPAPACQRSTYGNDRVVWTGLHEYRAARAATTSVHSFGSRASRLSIGNEVISTTLPDRRGSSDNGKRAA